MESIAKIYSKYRIIFINLHVHVLIKQGRSSRTRDKAEYIIQEKAEESQATN